MFKDRKTNYVAIKEIETVNKWIGLERSGSKLICNVMTDDRNELTDLMIGRYYNGFSYIPPKDWIIEFEIFEQEVLNTVEMFLNELRKLNSELLQTKMAENLCKKIRYIKSLDDFVL